MLRLFASSITIAGQVTANGANGQADLSCYGGGGGGSGGGVLIAVSGATVTIDDGLYTQTTDAMGNYNFTSVPAGTWQMSATTGSKSGSAQVTVTANNASTANLTVH